MPSSEKCIYIENATYYKVLILVLIFIYQGTGAVEVIWLDMAQIKHINLSPKVFEKMQKLRLLAFEGLKRDFKRINCVYLPKGLQFLPRNLRYFEWDGFPTKYLAPTSCSEKLVELPLPYNNAEKLCHRVQVCMIHVSLIKVEVYLQ